jgi:REP element-mobilizing transposase RayT
MGSLSEYGRTAGAVHSLGYHWVWCPKYRRPVLVGRVAERQRELLGAKCAEHGWTVEALEWSRSYLVASVGRVSEATIRRYIAEQTTRPTRGMP